jgi:hypothetical protein
MKALRNALEAYSYEMRNNLDAYGNWEKYLDDETRKTFLADLNVAIEWIYAEGETAPKSEYKMRIDKFKKIGEPVKARHFYYSELEVYYSQFEKVAETVNQKLGSIEHLTDSQKETINEKLRTTETLIAGVKADRASKQLHQDPAYTLDQIINAIEKCKRETEAIFNLPPPKSKPEESTADSGEKKTEADAKAPEADAEMKNEEPKAEEAK